MISIYPNPFTSARHPGLTNVKQDASVGGVELDVGEVAELLAVMMAAPGRSNSFGQGRPMRTGQHLQILAFGEDASQYP